MRRPLPSSLPPINCSKVAGEQDDIAKNQSRVKDNGMYDQTTYPNAYGDPDTVSLDIPKEELEGHEETGIQFVDELYDAFSGVSSEGEEF